MNLHIGHLNTDVVGEHPPASSESAASPWSAALRWREISEVRARDERRTADGDADD